MELECLCNDANEIESGVEVDDNDAFVCEVMGERLYGAPPGWSPSCAPNHWSPTVSTNKGEPLFQDVDNLEVGAHILLGRCLNQEVENTSVMPCLLALFLFLLML